MVDLEKTFALLDSAREELQKIGVELEWKFTGQVGVPLCQKHLEDKDERAMSDLEKALALLKSAKEKLSIVGVSLEWKIAMEPAYDDSSFSGLLSSDLDETAPKSGAGEGRTA